MTISYTTLNKDNGRKVYGILRHELALTSTSVKRLKAAGGIFLNGTPAFTTARVAENDVISVDLDLLERETALMPEYGDISVIWENEAFAVFNKPCGILVHPSHARLNGSLASLAAGYFERSGQRCACHVVNRLDRDTSGTVVIAKSAHYKTQIAESLSSEEGKKEYIAVLCGTIMPEKGVIDAPISRPDPQKMRRAVSPEGQRAVTHYRIMNTSEICGKTVSLAEFRLETGRTHQIRVHSSYMGAPLAGDSLYGTEETAAVSAKLGAEGHMLHAGSITFRDPISGELITAEAPLVRKDMVDVIRRYFN